MKEELTDDMKLFLQKQPYNLTVAKHNLGIHQLRVMVRMVGWKFNIYTKKEPKEVVPKKELPAPKNKLEHRLTTEFLLSMRQARNAIQAIPEKELKKALYDVQLRRINRELRNVGGYTAKYLADRFNVKI